jgi:hypothetical protein
MKHLSKMCEKRHRDIPEVLVAHVKHRSYLYSMNAARYSSQLRINDHCLAMRGEEKKLDFVVSMNLGFDWCFQ